MGSKNCEVYIDDTKWGVKAGFLYQYVEMNLIIMNFIVYKSWSLDNKKWWFPEIGVPRVIIHWKRWIFPYKPLILGYPHLWTPPNLHWAETNDICVEHEMGDVVNILCRSGCRVDRERICLKTGDSLRWFYEVSSNLLGKPRLGFEKCKLYWPAECTFKRHRIGIWHREMVACIVRTAVWFDPRGTICNSLLVVWYTQK